MIFRNGKFENCVKCKLQIEPNGPSCNLNFAFWD